MNTVTSSTPAEGGAPSRLLALNTAVLREYLEGSAARDREAAGARVRCRLRIRRENPRRVRKFRTPREEMGVGSAPVVAQQTLRRCDIPIEGFQAATITETTCPDFA